MVIRVKDIEIVEGLRKQDMLALHTAIDRYGDLIYKTLFNDIKTLPFFTKIISIQNIPKMNS